MTMSSGTSDLEALSGVFQSRIFVDELVSRGTTHAVFCPGSRSTPLLLALNAHPGMTALAHVDERSAAYFALGIAKATRRPVAVLCTSGTAAANFLPAIVEARHSRVPLIALTADRPHQLRDTGSLQSIDQVKLYGDQVKWFADVAPAEVATERYMRSVAAQALAMAQAAPSGPVHLNFPFSEPLVPALDTGSSEPDFLTARRTFWEAKIVLALRASNPSPPASPANRRGSSFAARSMNQAFRLRSRHLRIEPVTQSWPIPCPSFGAGIMIVPL